MAGGHSMDRQERDLPGRAPGVQMTTTLNVALLVTALVLLLKSLL